MQSPSAEPAEPPQKQKGVLAQLWSFFAPTIICCSIVILVNTIFVFYASVPTGSMKNLILEHSYILANRLAYTNSEVQRGDIIVFEHETNDPKVKYLVKRVVAVGGDTVELRDGQVILNGEVKDESAYVVGQTYAYHSQSVFTVPEGCVLVFGDNREYSADARYWDDPYLSVSTIRGKVFCSFSIRDWYFRTFA